VTTTLLVLVLAALLAVLGSLLVLVARHAAALREELQRGAEEQRRVLEEGRDEVVQRALDQLVQTNEAVLAQGRVAGAQELEGKKALIDQQLTSMGDQLTRNLARVTDLLHTQDADRQRSLGELGNEMRRQQEGVAALTQTTAQLREALSSSKVRGQWGERMAEDVLRLAGFLEGVNYRKQHTAAGGGLPDFTFLLPHDMTVHMDVKFPLDNYLRYLEAGSDLERRQFRDRFLRDVRDRVRELTTRGYIDARGSTLDCLLLFIPNEQVFGFVQEHDRDLVDLALRQKIVLCSPLSLYAVLAVIRQAVDSFRLERTSDEILRLLGEFNAQWEKYTAQLETVQKRFDVVARDYAALMGTRHRALQRPLDKIAALRRQVGLEEGGEADATEDDGPTGTVTGLDRAAAPVVRAIALDA